MTFFLQENVNPDDTEFVSLVITQESSFFFGLCYVVASVSIYDEYSNDVLDMPEGSCFPRFVSNGLSSNLYLSLSLFLFILKQWFYGFLTGQYIEETKRALVRQFLVVFQDRTLSRQLHQEEGQTKAQ